MGGREDDEPTAGSEKDRCSIQFLAIVLDVFENVDVDNGVELRTSFQAMQWTTYDLVRTRSVCLPQVQPQLSSELPIGLEADPPRIVSSIEVRSIGADAGADLEDMAGEEWPDPLRQVRLPVVCGCEQFQFGSGIFEITH